MKLSKRSLEALAKAKTIAKAREKSASKYYDRIVRGYGGASGKLRKR